MKRTCATFRPNAVSTKPGKMFSKLDRKAAWGLVEQTLTYPCCRLQQQLVAVEMADMPDSYSTMESRRVDCGVFWLNFNLIQSDFKIELCSTQKNHQKE